MITFLEGKLEIKEPTHVVMNVNGIGYHVKISLITYTAIKSLDQVRIHTHYHVKEDSQTLFGFHEISEKKRFRDLIGISGVGPSTALMVLSSLSPEELQSAIANENVKIIQSVKGIGAKTAQRIVLELKDKMKKEGLLDKALDLPQHINNSMRSEALSALTTLGINKPAAEKSIDTIMHEHDELRLEELIKLALKRA
jgi:Holliday junction DNA helicase RuvA